MVDVNHVGIVVVQMNTLRSRDVIRVGRTRSHVLHVLVR